MTHGCNTPMQVDGTPSSSLDWKASWPSSLVRTQHSLCGSMSSPPVSSQPRIFVDKVRTVLTASSRAMTKAYSVGQCTHAQSVVQPAHKKIPLLAPFTLQSWFNHQPQELILQADLTMCR